MRHQVFLAATICAVLSLSSNGARAQQPQAPAKQATAVAEPEAPRVVLQAETTASVLRLMKFSGALRDRAGNARTGAVGLTFALYKDQQGGSPLWLEVQNAQLDEQGRYTVLLGSTKSEGLPLEMFSSGEARWLGVQLNLPGEEEQARVLLVSVPYALKAADAETLGGKPPSAFLLADPVGADLRVRPEAGKEAAKEGPPREGVVGPINGEGTIDSLAKFTGANAIGNAGIVEVSGKVGIGTASPNVKLSLGTDVTAQKFALWDGVGDFYGLGVDFGRIVFHTGNTEKMTITSGGNVGIGTAAPTRMLHVAGNAAIIGNVTIGTTMGEAKLSLGTDITTKKLALYDGVGDFYGLGVDFGRIVLHTANTEKMTITSTGNVGIGTTAPAEKLDVAGAVKGTQLTSTVSTGTAPLTVSSTTKVTNLNADLLDGMDSTGFAASVHDHVGQSWSGSGFSGLQVTNTDSDGFSSFGLRGINQDSAGAGVFGSSTSTGVNQAAGVHGESSAQLGRGVLGIASNASGPTEGVHGEAFSTQAIGVLGVTTATSGATIGVKGKAASLNGFGGFFVNTAASSILLAASTSDSTGDMKFRVTSAGNVFADGSYNCGNSISDAAGDLDETEIEPCLKDDSPADFAEMLPAGEKGLEPGDVLVVGASGTLQRSHAAFARSVVGVHSTRPSYLGNSRHAGKQGYAPLAIVGIVPVKASAENGPIAPGQLLVASGTPGHAMRAGEDTPPGTVLGKALEGLAAGRGKVLMLLMPR